MKKNQLEEKKIMLELPNGESVDLKDLLKEESLAQLEAMGFKMENGKLASLPGEFKTEAMEKQEKVEAAANFIKSIIIPGKLHEKYGVKQVTTDSGSYGASVPTELAAEIVAKRDKFSVLGARAFKLDSAGPFDVPVEGTDITGYWVGESDSGDANLITESEPTLDKKSLGDHYLAALCKVSFKLMNTSAFNIVNYISSLAGRKLAETEEAAYIGGNGTGKPKGLRTESVGSIAQAGAGLSYQDMVDLYFSLPPQYRANAVWITSSMGAKAITGLRDSQERPIFSPGSPLDEMFRKPLLESTDMPENLGAGNDTTEIWFGDPSFYWVKYGTGMEMATESNVERLQTKVVTYQAVDGKLTLTDAFKKLTGVKTDIES